MKRCEYSKCGKDFEPNKPKQVFCCATHRVYASREKKATEKPLEAQKRALPKKPAKDTSVKDFAGNSPKTNHNVNIPPIIDKAAKIKAFEEEYATIPDIGLGKQRRKWIEKQIADLKAGR